LTALIEERANIVAVVTRPPSSSGSVCDYADLHDVCEASGITTIETSDINSLSTLCAIRRAAPDYIYTLGWSQLFGDDLLSIPKHYIVGSHPSALPFGRGRAPIPWTVLQQLRRSAVTLFQMEQAADAGAILMQDWFELSARADATEVYQKAAESLARAYVALHQVHRAEVPLRAVAQLEEEVTYRERRRPADGHIDFYRPAEEVARLVRAATRPYPGAYAYHNRNELAERVTIWRAALDDVLPYIGTPGQILLCRGDRLLVQAGDRPVWFWDFAIDGRSVAASEFQVGTKFGLAVEDELVALRRQVAELQHTLARLTGGTSARSAA
jgi:methionyl-tRNA formyltransferase